MSESAESPPKTFQRHQHQQSSKKNPNTLDKSITEDNQQGQSSSKGQKIKGQKDSSPQHHQQQQVVVKNNKKFTVRRRPSPKSVPQRPNDVYITERSNFKAQISKCQRLFDGDHSEVFLHGLATAIPRAINVALELKKFYQGTVDFSVSTSTIHIIDDLIPLDETTQASQQSRKVSCVDVRVFRTVNIP